ncbi:MAG: alpha/beta hydrolase [Clostridiales bacterium]|nr:alpha/beta hydrolase [Clostridiales bacterium]
MTEQKMEEIARIVSQTREQTDKVNREMEIHGQRVEIPLAKRKILTAFYPAERSNASILFAFHGGGFCFGGCCVEDALYDELRCRLGINVVSVGYRKGVAFPAALDDCYETILYYIEHAEYLFDWSRIMTFGCSAGANLASAVSIRAWREGRFRIEKRFLNYPFLDLVTPPMEKKLAKESDEPMFSYFNYAYAPPGQRSDPLISPLYARKEDLDPSTKTLIFLAEQDSLREEGRLFAEKLRQFGHPVVCHLVKNMPHGYLEYGYRDLSGWCPPELKQVIDDGSLRKACGCTMDKIERFYVEN